MSEDKTVGQVFNEFSNEEKELLYWAVGTALDALDLHEVRGSLHQSYIYHQMSKEKKKVFLYILGQASQERDGIKEFIITI